MLSLHWSVQSHMPATELYHVMYLSDHSSLPRVWWTCLYVHKGGKERESTPLPPTAALPCVPSSLFCNSLPRSSLALVLVSNRSLPGITKVASQLWALGTKYRSKPHPTLSHPKDRFQRASDFVFSLYFQKLASFFPQAPPPNSSSQPLLQTPVGKFLKPFSCVN